MNLDDLGGNHDHDDGDEGPHPDEVLYPPNNLLELMNEDDSLPLLGMAINLAEKSFFFKFLSLEERLAEVKKAFESLSDILYNDGDEL